MSNATVYTVDGDLSMRTALRRLLKSEGLKAVSFPSAEKFLKSEIPDEPCCLLLDIRLKGMSGLDLQQELSRLNREIPIIFVTEHGDIRMAVRAIQAGAIEFLPKPFQNSELLGAIRRAISQYAVVHRNRTNLDRIKARIESLTKRQYEVMYSVVKGMLNKQIAGQLGIAEKTVKVHRAHVMEKMNVASVAELTRMIVEFEKLSIFRKLDWSEKSSPLEPHCTPQHAFSSARC